MTNHADNIEQSTLDMEIELDDMPSASSRLIDGQYVFQNDILSGSIPSILGFKLRQMYLDQQLQDLSHFKKCQITDHGYEDFCFFCRDCSLCLCSKCVPVHSSHDIITYAAAIDEKFDNLAGAVSQFSDIHISLLKALESTKERKSIFSTDISDLKKSIHERFIELHDKLDEIKEDLYDRIDKVGQPFFEQCDNSVNTWHAYAEMTRPHAEMKHTLPVLLQTEDIFKLEEKTRMKLIEAKKNLPSLSPPQRLKLEVQWNEKAINTLLNTDTVGDIHHRLALDPSQRLTKFSARHIQDKSPTCIESMAVTPLGDFLLLIDAGNVKAKVFCRDGRIKRCFVGGGRYHLVAPSDILVMPDGAILVCDPGDEKVVYFSENGLGKDYIPVDACECLFQTPDGSIGAISSLCKTIEWLQIREGRLCKTRVPTELQHMGLLSKPRHAIYNATSHCIFVVDPYEHCCFVFNLDGTFVRRYGKLGQSFAEMNGPGSLAIDNKGNVLLADTVNHRVHVLDSTGNFIRFALTGENSIRYPHALAIDNQRFLWIVQRDGHVKQFPYD